MLVDWFRDGAPLESSEVVRITRIDPVTSVLAISSLTASMAGNYTCVAKNEVAMVEEAAVLVVRGLYSGLHLVALTFHMVQGRSLGTGESENLRCHSRKKLFNENPDSTTSAKPDDPKPIPILMSASYFKCRFWLESKSAQLKMTQFCQIVQPSLKLIGRKFGNRRRPGIGGFRPTLSLHAHYSRHHTRTLS